MALYLKGGWSVLNWTIAGLMASFLVINLLRGPTCESHLQTAVQTEKLHSLYRLNTAKKIINRLRLLIEQAQGKLSPEDFRKAEVKAPTAKIAGVQSETADVSVRKVGKKVHQFLFATLIFDGLVTCFDFFYNHVTITLLGTGISMAACVLVIMAVVRQYKSNLKSSLRIITWAAFAYLCVTIVLGYILYFVVAFRNPAMSHNQWEMIKALSQMSPDDSSMMMGFYLFSICSSSMLGISGLFASRK